MTAPKTMNVIALRTPPSSSIEIADLAAVTAPQATEDCSADERGDEARSAHSVGDAVREHGRGEWHDLEPRPVDETAPAREDDDTGGQHTGYGSTEDAEADLLENQAERRHVADIAGLRLCDREHDEEQWHADPVVQSALDVEALADARRKPG